MAPTRSLLRPLLILTGLAGVASAWTRAGPFDLPSNAYAFQAGPSVPIANGHLYTLDTGSGAMSDLGRPVCFGGPLAFNADGSRLLAWSGIIQAHGPAVGGLFDLTTPPGVQVGSAAPFGTECGLARDPTSDRFYLLAYTDADTSLYEVNPATAACRFIGYQWGVNASSIAIDSHGRAFATQVEGPKTLYSVGLGDGSLTPIGPLSLTIAGDQSQALCFDSADTLWMITGGTVGTPAALYNVSTLTGQATSVRPLSVSGWYVGLAIHP